MQGGRTRHRRQDARLGVEFGEHDAVAEDVSQNVLDVVGCADPELAGAAAGASEAGADCFAANESDAGATEDAGAEDGACAGLGIAAVPDSREE